ncbi:hypothetical protein N7489_009214 [Penicillium chrysogenum]|uniref:Uncharacterized protein n=1 Tax=Penicillium chrysogenum TaxID=5076 RepID=A0ABQ8WY71_PENCH|nr:uncharacterized protein N7489_009214 [Penicillium chrysogenum]XP_061069720.1 uncharacterized protein N7525_003415 [Penicillium rubens]KAJ5228506.1 hypothetical protein N7489_009214 [Penicillium chrysogenum]KAJ5283863.1 hypothetical protein N7505_001843 [Penicillium chrysogenum]KAJ5838227.1 hypothetical protein N7525_003415 [Penicillium rubens]KAJ5866275.1 hypothetical protein N7534_000828 [Penicillium rubens]
MPSRNRALNKSDAESEQQRNPRPANTTDHSVVTSSGGPAHRSRRERSEYRSWERGRDVPRKGTTGSRSRSVSRH